MMTKTDPVAPAVRPTIKTVYLQEHHKGLPYYYLPEDALCPYVSITLDEVLEAPEPFFVYNIREECGVGVPAARGRNVIVEPRLWTDVQRKRFQKLSKAFSGFQSMVTVGWIDSLDVSTVMGWGGDHFLYYHVTVKDVKAMLTWGEGLRYLLLQVATREGELVLTDFSILTKTECCAIFCDWAEKFRAISPGIYACILAAEETERRGLGRYNLGIEYPYKLSMATSLETTYGVAKLPPSHPFLDDPTGPAAVFGREQINQFTR